MNKVIEMGRLTRDPEVRNQGDEGKMVARYTLAVDRRIKTQDGQTADYVPCVAFGKAAEFVQKYLRKGMKIAITGRIHSGSYTNKDGQKVYTLDVVVEEQEFAEPKRQQSGQQDAGAGQQDIDGFMNIPDGVEEELPFA